MNIPSGLRYARTHEWLRLEPDGSVSVGITDHAQQMLGDIVFVELPAPGRRFGAGTQCAVVESVKAAADIYAPLAGEVLEANAGLADAPQSINDDPYGAWLFRLRPDDPAQAALLMDAQAYGAQIAGEEH